MLWRWSLGIGCLHDSDIAGDIDLRKFTLGYLVTFAGSSFMAIQVAKVCGIIYYEAEFLAITSLQGHVVDEEIPQGIGYEARAPCYA